MFEWSRILTGTCKPLIVLALTEFEQMLSSKRLGPNETSVVHFTRSFHARYPQLGIDLKTFHRKFRVSLAEKPIILFKKYFQFRTVGSLGRR